MRSVVTPGPVHGNRKTAVSLFLLSLKAEARRALFRRVVLGVVLLGVVLQILLSLNNHYEAGEERKGIETLHKALNRADSSDDPRGKNLSPDEQKRVEETLISMQKNLRGFKENLGTQNSHRVTLSFLGTAPGVFLTIFLSASMFGADFRWGYWKMLAMHAPRGRVLTTKLIVFAAIVFVFIVIALVTSYLVNAVFARIYGFEGQMGWPSFLSLAGWIGRAWLSLITYGLLCAAVVTVTASALAGAGGISGFILLDSVLAERFSWARAVSLAQQVGNLFGDAPRVVGMNSLAWTSEPENLYAITFVPVSYEKAVVLLAVVAALSTLAAFIGIRFREL